jgi:hypothetical protein
MSTVMIRSEKINEMEKKAEKMVESSETYKIRAIKVNKKESNRKVCVVDIISFSQQMNYYYNC